MKLDSKDLKQINIYVDRHFAEGDFAEMALDCGWFSTSSAIRELMYRAVAQWKELKKEKRRLATSNR